MSFSEITARGVLPFVFSYFWGYSAIWWATPIGWTGSILIGLIRYRSGKWKEEANQAITSGARTPSEKIPESVEKSDSPS